MPSTSNVSVPTRDDVEKAFAEVSQVISSSLRPLPTQTGDHTYLPGKESSSLWQQLQQVNLENATTMTEVTIRGLTGEPVEDKHYLMEKAIKIAANLPLQSTAGLTISNAMISELWSDLKHPPLSYLGEDFIYRKADGSGNHVMWPHIGAAGMSYARSVRPETIRPIALPDPGIIFDSVLARRIFKPHPNKISSVLFHLATIIIHDLFGTDPEDSSKSLTSSYLDLAPLYGNNQAEQNVMRTFENGKIKPDCFSAKRILGFPPGVGVLLIMFNRFHNYVVEQLALIDENKRFSSIRFPPGKPCDRDTELKYDNALFQTGRLITGGMYIQCILKDYVRTILNLNRTNSPWDLDPRNPVGSSFFREGPAEAGGNTVSAEFNLVYRWHSCVSEKDEEWTKGAFRDILGDSPSPDLPTFLRRLSQWAQSIPEDPEKRPFAGLERTPDGRFEDDDLAAIFTASVEDQAGAYGPRNVPEILREIEILGMNQARSWNLASLNEFRKFFNLTPHKTFEDISSDPYVAEQLERLYDHPDFVELYPGILLEDTKEPIVPGSGLCTNFTVSRAVLSDAVALVRGDRFYTVDYTPKSLTNWGFNEVNYDLTVDSGCVLYKLILRALPRHFRQNSVYAHYPLVIPTENEAILTSLGTAGNYSFEKPCAVPELTFINSYAACKVILDNKIDFHVTWGIDSIDFLMSLGAQNYGKDFMLSGDTSRNLRSRALMEPALYPATWKQEVQAFYEDITLKLLHENSYKIAGVNQVDIVRDVSNFAQVHFASSMFSLPLKTRENPRGVFAESELYMILALVFTCIFYDADPPKSFPLRQASRTLAQQLGKLVELNVEYVSKTSKMAFFLDRFHQQSTLSNYGVHMIRRLLQSGLSPTEIVYSHIMGTLGGMVANQSQLFSQCLDYYLSDEGKAHLPEINRLSRLDTPEADDKLLRYFLEGSRLRASVGLYRDIGSSSEIDDGGSIVTLQAGHRVMCNLVSASKDGTAFTSPGEVRLDRDMETYIHYGTGSHVCLGKDMNMTGMAAMLKTVGRLDNLRRVPGPQGEIKKIALPHGFTSYMTEDQRSYWPFPSSMKVNWDGELSALKKSKT